MFAFLPQAKARGFPTRDHYENDLVLDYCCGSGTTGVACLNLNRKFIGLEIDEKYYNIAKTRIENNN